MPFCMKVALSQLFDMKKAAHGWRSSMAKLSLRACLCST